jgi:hypothetical protein
LANLIVKSTLTLSHRTVVVRRWHNDQGSVQRSALPAGCACGYDDEDAGNTAAFLASRQPKRLDTLIASALLVLLIAGWVMNFVSVGQLSLGLGLHRAQPLVTPDRHFAERAYSVSSSLAAST